MRFTPDFLDEIKTRLAVSDVVGRRVRLKKQGREWRGLSPFNSEKTPSFFVNDGKMAWFDFSSGRNGNIFDFVMATEGLTFPEAVERLAGEAGLDLPRTTPEAAAQEQQRAGLTEVLDWATAFFEKALAGSEGARARAYLDGRGLGPDVRREFRIGFAPAERFALRDHLAGKGASSEVMIAAGLLVHGEDIAVPYDRFRDRVMFPIADRSGRIIAFGGRALDASVPAKYLNSPETVLFHKGTVLYNHHKARKAASDRGSVIAVEGYVDAIAMTAAGFPNVVASLGTAFTPQHCDLLWRLAPEPILCFDGDAAGRRAAFKAIDTVLPLIGPDRSLRFAFMPEGQDPDDLARTGGAAAIAEVLEKARPLVDVLWLRETESAPLDTPEQRAGLERRLGDLGRQIADETLRRYYASELRQRLAQLTRPGQLYRPRAAAPGQSWGAARRPPFGKPPMRGLVGSALPPVSQSLKMSLLQASGYARRDVEILMLVLNHPALLERYAEDLAHLDLGHADLRRLRDVLVDLADERTADHARLKASIDARGLGPLRRGIELFAEKLPHWCRTPQAALDDAGLVLHQALGLHRKARELHKELKIAEIAYGRDQTERNFARIRELLGLLSTVEGTEATIEGFGIQSGHKPSDV